MTEEVCLHLINTKIHAFLDGLDDYQKSIYRDYSVVFRYDKYSLGILKILPKIHKIKGEIDKETWRLLSSRPIRGAECDPNNIPSKALYKMLQEMLQGFGALFPKMSKYPNISSFTVLKGCDEYINKISTIELEVDSFNSTYLISADFGDAYTETQIHRLEESITIIGALLNYNKARVDLVVSLMKLVYTNCYFKTPFGIFRQTKGMPMGDVNCQNGKCTTWTIQEWKMHDLKNDKKCTP